MNSTAIPQTKLSLENAIKSVLFASEDVLVLNTDILRALDTIEDELRKRLTWLGTANAFRRSFALLQGTRSNALIANYFASEARKQFEEMEPFFKKILDARQDKPEEKRLFSGENNPSAFFKNEAQNFLAPEGVRRDPKNGKVETDVTAAH